MFDSVCTKRDMKHPINTLEGLLHAATTTTTGTALSHIWLFQNPKPHIRSKHNLVLHFEALSCYCLSWIIGPLKTILIQLKLCGKKTFRNAQLLTFQWFDILVCRRPCSTRSRQHLQFAQKLLHHSETNSIKSIYKYNLTNMRRWAINLNGRWLFSKIRTVTIWIPG